MIKIGASLNPKNLLIKCKDIFAWSHTNMLAINQHKSITRYLLIQTLSRLYNVVDHSIKTNAKLFKKKLTNY